MCVSVTVRVTVVTTAGVRIGKLSVRDDRVRDACVREMSA